MNNDCCFCSEYLHTSDSQYYVELGKKIGFKSRILLETKHWYAIPTLGCFSVGYILLVCKHHYQSLSTLSSELYNDMLHLKSLVEARIYLKLGQKCIAFEHGSSSASHSGAKSVDHVHLHILPFSEEVWPYISSKFDLNEFIAFPDYNKLFSTWEKYKPNTYLLFQDLNGIIYYKTNVCTFPSQFFRKCLASYVGTKRWNWREDYCEKNIVDTIKLFL